MKEPATTYITAVQGARPVTPRLCGSKADALRQGRASVQCSNAKLPPAQTLL